MPREENPFLGIRGVRIGLDRPEILRTQVRAILRAGKGNRLRMMFPMIATLDEIRSVKGLVEEERAKLPETDPVELGIMVEVPSAAIMARQFAREVDFFSIGTNDLTQYTLAMDRGHPKLGAKADAMNPAVLRLIAQTVAGGRRRGQVGGRLRRPRQRPPGGAHPGGAGGAGALLQRPGHPSREGGGARPVLRRMPGPRSTGPGRRTPPRRCAPWSPSTTELPTGA